MKVFLDMVGCRLNQSELENYARQFRQAGHTLTSDADSADLVVINTCTVTSAAAADSRQMIRKAGCHGARQVVVTGCWATLNENEVKTLPGVIQVIENPKKDELVPLVLNLPRDSLVQLPIVREPIPGSRMRTRSFIKVQDGCDNYCTYCITRLARVPVKAALQEVLYDIRSALEGGSQEIILTGVHPGSWGYDFTPSHLSFLVSTILAETAAPRLRLSSLEPWDVPPGFFELWQNQHLCRHLHLPLQSGCEATLQRMGRRITVRFFAGLVKRARAAIPGIAITTDIITGFPGETEAEFEESLEFVRGLGFANGHVFTYSAWPGSARLPGYPPGRITWRRNAMPGCASIPP
jgi:threonylcarbamoyladenosine tRNA methylthiotransferase MtaB